MAWTVPAPGIVELIRHFFPNPDAAGASATARGAAAAADDVVTIEELKSSSRVRFWVPPQLMKEFLD